MKSQISRESIHTFKTSYCNENQKIAQIFRSQLARYCLEPLLDVGSGLGDITATAFPEKQVIHLDPLDFSRHPLPQTHIRIKSDFFEYVPEVKVRTVVCSHVLQYLDEDVEKLNEVLKNISPEVVVTVTNTNDDFLKDLLVWFETRVPEANPEVTIPGFPKGYVEELVVPFVADVRCPDFGVLARQVCYLFEVELLETYIQPLSEFLKQRLETPTFQIHQRVTVYKKAE